jgi:hypothetical protein
MDNLDLKTPVQPEAGDLREQLDQLRHVIVSVLILVIVVSGTLNIYLLRQWRTVSKDLGAIRPQAEQMFAEYQKVSGPMMNDFVKKLAEYGRSHPDFAPVLAKYGVRPSNLTNAPSASPTAPAAAGPKK